MKQKTRKAAAKRLKITGTGKVMRRLAFGRHLRRHKSKKAIRRYRKMTSVKGRIGRTAKRMLAIA